jgi:hypothetical protein
MTRVRNGQFSLESWGNGLVYVLINHASHKSVFVQGGDALSFEADKDAAEACFPHWSAERILFWLWDVCDYGSAAVDREFNAA